MTDWPEFRLGDLVLINYRSIDKDYPYKQIEYLDTGSITDGKITSFQTLFLREAPSRAKRIVQNNDVILSMVRPIQRHYGFIKNVKPNMIVSTGFVVLTCKEKIEPYYLYSFLTQREITEYLDVVAEGSTSAYPAFTPEVLENMAILLPPLPEQRAIAAVLSSMDDKIDLLNRQNKTLEGLAETSWRKMFVEDAKDTWNETNLEEICTITRGASPRPIINYVIDGTVPWIKIADATASSSYFIYKTHEFITEDGMRKSVKVHPGDLILSNSATCGFPYFVDVEGCIHDGWLLFRNFKVVSKTFIFFFLKQLNRELNYIADGSVQNNLNTGLLKEYGLKLPPVNLIQKFDILGNIIIDRIRQNTIQIRTLSALRDTLLPKLMSGGVRVEEFNNER